MPSKWTLEKEIHVVDLPLEPWNPVCLALDEPAVEEPALPGDETLSSSRQPRPAAEAARPSKSDSGQKDPGESTPAQNAHRYRFVQHMVVARRRISVLHALARCRIPHELVLEVCSQVVLKRIPRLSLWDLEGLERTARVLLGVDPILGRHALETVMIQALIENAYIHLHTDPRDVEGDFMHSPRRKLLTQLTDRIRHLILTGKLVLPPPQSYHYHFASNLLSLANILPHLQSLTLRLTIWAPIYNVAQGDNPFMLCLSPDHNPKAEGTLEFLAAVVAAFRCGAPSTHNSIEAYLTLPKWNFIGPTVVMPPTTPDGPTNEQLLERILVPHIQIEDHLYDQHWKEYWDFHNRDCWTLFAYETDIEESSDEKPLRSGTSIFQSNARRTRYVL